MMGEQNMGGGKARICLALTILGTIGNFIVNERSPSPIGIGSRARWKEEEMLWHSPVDQTVLTC